MNDELKVKEILAKALARDSVNGNVPQCGPVLAEFYREHCDGSVNPAEKLLYILGHVVDQMVEGRR